MDPRRLNLLVELSRRGSMRAVADVTGLATSVVSQQLAVLARETKTVLIEPIGRNVRLTPAGLRLVQHAITILGAIEAARADLDPAGEPSGVVRVAAFATAARDALVPLVRSLQSAHPTVTLQIQEQEPAEVRQQLADDQIDLGLVYDYNLAPHVPDRSTSERPLWKTPWALGIPSEISVTPGDSIAVFRQFATVDWIVNSRGSADDQVIQTIGAMADFAPNVVHRADSLDLVQDLIVAGLGVGLLPADRPPNPGVQIVALAEPAVHLRVFAVTRPGRDRWAPLDLVLSLLEEHSAGLR